MMKKEYKNNDEKILAGFRHFSKILRHEASFGHHGKTRILNVLCAEGAMTQKKLQDEVEIASGSASELLKKMEDHGLITRTTDPDDSRGLIVEVTDAGRELNDRLAAEKSEKAKKLMEKGRNKSKVTILSRLKPDELKALTVLIRNSGFSPSLLDKDISDPELSIVSVKGDSVRGVILIGHHGDDLTVPLIINDDDRSLESAALFAALCAQLSHEEFQDKRIYYVPANEKINELLVWLLGEESSIRKEQTLNTGLLLLNENR